MSSTGTFDMTSLMCENKDFIRNDDCTKQDIPTPVTAALTLSAPCHGTCVISDCPCLPINARRDLTYDLTIPGHLATYFNTLNIISNGLSACLRLFCHMVLEPNIL